MADQIVRDDEDVKTEIWRRKQARKLGLPPKAARLFAEESQASIRDLESLIRRGCDPLTAFDILL